MSVVVRVGKAMDKVYLWMRDRRAFEVTSGEMGSFDALRGRKYALLVTFRRNGKAVPTPVWFGIGGNGFVYVQAFSDAGKIKRLRNDPRALLAPSNPRGKPLGPVIEGRGRVLPAEECAAAEEAIQANYGLGRRMYMLPSKNRRPITYLEIAPQTS